MWTYLLIIMIIGGVFSALGSHRVRDLLQHFSRGRRPDSMRSEWDQQGDRFALGCWIFILLIFAILAAIILAALYWPDWFFSDQNPLN